MSIDGQERAWSPYAEIDLPAGANQIPAMIIDAAAIERVCSSWGISRLRVFGSVVRGDAAPGSDLDLLVEFSRQVSLLDLVGLEQDFEDALGVKVDVVTPASLSPFIRDEVLREAKIIYERPAA